MANRSLPEKFIEKMKRLWGEEEFTAYAECLSRSMEHGLRVNTLRLDPEEFRRDSSLNLEPIPWCPSGFYLSDDAEENPPSRDPLYSAGAYYLQEPSAMLPAAALPVRPGDRVLDLCAAPGGKSTALAEKLKGSGVLVCNDISASRAKALVKNLELFGVVNAIVTAETPERLAGVFPDYFDRILIDAPCSGEGMFRKSSAMIADWTEDKPAEYAGIQREILPFALRMLRPGGMLVYSTCTYSPEEDEASVYYLLKLPEAEEKKMKVAALPLYEGFLPGDPEWLTEGTSENDSELRESLRNTVHLIPHRVRGEGHFVALLKSCVTEDDAREENESGHGGLPVAADPAERKKNTEALRKKYPEFAEFAAETRILWDLNRMKSAGGYLSILPEKDLAYLKSLSGIHFLRQGLFLGEIKKNRFEPSQALAMALSPESFPNSLMLQPGDERVQRYLRGETIEYADGEAADGWVLITLKGLPLGFGKAKDGRIKNKYLPGWRTGA